MVIKPRLLSTTLVLAVIAILGFTWWWNQPCRSGCNVILIMVDTLSAQHLATYGYDRDTMPKTTAFFEKGVIFENANSNAPWTLPSFTSMYFSDLASHVTYAELEDGSRPTLQSELRKGGVKVRAVVPGGRVIFDTITRLYKPEEMNMSEGRSPFRLGLGELFNLEANKKPFFLLIHSLQAHDPYHPPEPFNKKYLETDEYPFVSRDEILKAYTNGQLDPKISDVFRLRYDQQLSMVDEDMASFLNTIPPSVLEHTVVILAADHGEAFGEHDVLYHANSLFQEETHIPLMMRVPGVGAKRISEPVSLLDMTPTVLSFLGVQSPKTFLGTSMKPLLSDNTLGERVIPSVNGSPYFFGPNFNPPRMYDSLEDAGAKGKDVSIIELLSVGIRKGANKVFFLYPKNATTPEKHAGLNWYNLNDDPEEKNNLAKGKSADGLPTELANPLKTLMGEVEEQSK